MTGKKVGSRGKTRKACGVCGLGMHANNPPIVGRLRLPGLHGASKGESMNEPGKPSVTVNRRRWQKARVRLQVRYAGARDLVWVRGDAWVEVGAPFESKGYPISAKGRTRTEEERSTIIGFRSNLVGSTGSQLVLDAQYTELMSEFATDPDVAPEPVAEWLERVTEGLDS